MDDVIAFLSGPVGVAAMGLSALGLSVVAVALGLIAVLRPPPDRKKRLQWARWETNSGDYGNDHAFTNLIVWNGGPAIRESDIAPLAPVQVVAVDGAELGQIEVIATNNPRNGVKLRRRTEHRTKSRIDFAYLNENDGFVLRVRHTGTSSQIRLEGEIIGAPAPQWSGDQLARSWMPLVVRHLHGPRHATWRRNLERFTNLSVLVMMPLAPFVFQVDWDLRLLIPYEIASGIAIALSQLTTVRTDWTPLIPAGLEAVLGLSPPTRNSRAD